MNKEIDSKYYEKQLLKHNILYDKITKALDIVKRYIIRENKMLVGGMAIDMALRMKDRTDSVYDEDVLPDYDFYSDKHYEDAYNIAQWLSRLGFTEISVIHALHPSTMRVRINMTTVADITYVPPTILQNIPFLRYNKFILVHPHYQMIAQHRALSFPYENAPWETILNRPKKDMHRYDLLYKHYPLRILNTTNTNIELTPEKSIKTEFLEGNCITGFCALNYWIKKARDLGYENHKKFKSFGTFELRDDLLKYKIPLDSGRITIYSDDFKKLYIAIKKHYEIKEEKFYNKFLDNIPRKILLNNEIEILENTQKISAHKIPKHKISAHKLQNSESEDIYVANLQNIMMYLLTNYVILMKINGVKRGHSFYEGYLLCRDIIEWAGDKYYSSKNKDEKKELVELLPTYEIYGRFEISEDYRIARLKFDYKNVSINAKHKELVDLYKNNSQPSQVHDRDLIYKKVPRKYYDFDYSKSDIFSLDGAETVSFLNEYDYLNKHFNTTS